MNYPPGTVMGISLFHTFLFSGAALHQRCGGGEQVKKKHLFIEAPVEVVQLVYLHPVSLPSTQP